MLRKLVLNSLYFSGLQALLAPMTRGSGAILMLHHVRSVKEKAFSPNHHLNASPKFLDKLLANLRNSGVEFLSLDQLAERLIHPEEARLHPPFVAMTLDDGYRDVMENAVPVFRKYDMPYTVYVAPGMVDGNAMLWWEDLEAIIAARPVIHVDLPGGRAEFDTSTIAKKNTVFCELFDFLESKVDPEQQRRIVMDLALYYGLDPKEHLKSEIMTWQEIGDLAKDPLCTIGAHSISHYMLSKLDERKTNYEIEQSAEIIKSEVGYRPKHFAYPYGSPIAAGAREFEMAARSGFKTAVTTRHGVIYPEHSEHLLALPRVSLNGHFQAVRYAKTLMSGVPTRILNRGEKLNVA